ncbi:restriction endonuclease subunit R [Microcoleus sp. w1-18aA5]|uniref:restriction endonuclease subunit R n=1 Tax=Microcoleus sp. w1-18aA5 TaxID=2818982 RepID=UPI0040408903
MQYLSIKENLASFAIINYEANFNKLVAFMVQTIQARNVALNDLETQFKIEWVEDDQFFREWQDDLPEISDYEKQRLDRVKASYRNLLKHPPLLENTVKMVVLSPFLDLADFYLAPFHVTSEKSVEIVDEDEGLIVSGQLDVLALFQEFWVVVIESKKAAFSLEVGIPQLLAYMLANLSTDRSTYGLLMNGADFLFVKLVKRETAQYAFSRKFYLFNPGNDLYSVLSILKRLGQLNVGNLV